jgi:hypothetical protein
LGKLIFQKETSGIFHDPVTGLSIVRDAKVPYEGRLGKKTQEWLRKGALKTEEVPDCSSPPSPAPLQESGGSGVTIPAPEPTVSPKEVPEQKVSKPAVVKHKSKTPVKAKK